MGQHIHFLFLPGRGPGAGLGTGKLGSLQESGGGVLEVASTALWVGRREEGGLERGRLSEGGW